MKKHANDLFRIGEVTKILGVTCKALLVYEDAGLLNPAVKDEESGYRYYSADNLTQIRAIRSLQALGLTLKEVAEYYYDTENIELHLKRLTELRASLDRNIRLLQIRSAPRGDMTVRKATLPAQVCFCQRYQCTDPVHAADQMRVTFSAAARTGKLSASFQMFSIRDLSDPRILDLTCCVPVEESFDGPERMEFAETPALCIYYRGPYEKIGDAVRALSQYVAENGVETTGPFRSIYLEGPPSRGANSEDYVTQIAVPVKE